MKVTIIPSDKTVVIDGRGFGGIDMSSIAENIHAVQWHGDRGEIEFKPDAEGGKPENRRIESLQPFDDLIGQWNALRAAEDAPPPPPTPEEIELDYIAMLEGHYDAKAMERRYDDRKSCAMRACYPGPFYMEGQAFATWMDNCNALGYQVMAEAKSGARPLPGKDELIAMLPALVWPA